MRLRYGWLLLGGLCAASGAAMAEPDEPYQVPIGLPRQAVLEALQQPAWSGTHRGARADAFQRPPPKRREDHPAQAAYHAVYLVVYDRHDRALTVIQSDAKDAVRRVGEWAKCGKRHGPNAAKAEARCTPVIEPLYRAQRTADAADAMTQAAQYREAGNQERAESFYQRALAAAEELHGADSRQVADVLKEYAAFLRKTGEIEDAASMEGRIQEILSPGQADEAPAGP